MMRGCVVPSAVTTLLTASAINKSPACSMNAGTVRNGDMDLQCAAEDRVQLENVAQQHADAGRIGLALRLRCQRTQAGHHLRQHFSGSSLS